MNKTYVFITAIAGSVTGGLIYPRNKIKFLKEAGWNVVLFPTSDGKVFISGLEQFRDPSFQFLNISPSEMKKKQLDKCIKMMLQKIPNSEEIIIETGTVVTSYWGEILASKLKCRHVIFLLDEYNNKIGLSNASYYNFKYNRGELLCISDRSLEKIFSKYFLVAGNPYPFKAYCHNSIEDISTDLDKKIREIKSDFCIGTVGRLEKKVVEEVITGVTEFSNKNPGLKIKLVCFGGGKKRVKHTIKKKLSHYKLISVLFTGYIFPIPLKAAEECDLFISTQGGASATAAVGLPTVRIDVYDNKPIGFIINRKYNSYYTIDSVKTSDYISWFYNNRHLLNIDSEDISERWKMFCKEFENQINYVERLNSKYKYFQTANIQNASIGKIKKILCHTLGVKWTVIIGKLYSKLVSLYR